MNIRDYAPGGPVDPHAPMKAEWRALEAELNGQFDKLQMWSKARYYLSIGAIVGVLMMLAGSGLGWLHVSGAHTLFVAGTVLFILFSIVDYWILHKINRCYHKALDTFAQLMLSMGKLGRAGIGVDVNIRRT